MQVIKVKHELYDDSNIDSKEKQIWFIYFISQCEAKNKSMLEAELMEVQYLLVKRLINIIVVDKEKNNIKQ